MNDIKYSSAATHDLISVLAIYFARFVIECECQAKMVSFSIENDRTAALS